MAKRIKETIIRRLSQTTHPFVRISILSLAAFFTGLAGQAQSAAVAPSPKFAVASVRPGDPNVQRGSFEYTPESGKFQSNAATLDQLIGFAYDVRVHQIVGGPKWRDSSGFTIVAIADESSMPIPSNTAGTQIFRTMVQGLLAERFQFVAHEETRESQVYELVLDKNGSKLKEATATSSGGGMNFSPGQIIGTAAPIRLLVNQLTRQLGRTVIDKTGLTGKYDFALKWDPNMNLAEPAAPPPESSGPSVFTAVQEQLGLRLQAAKGPVKFVIIDRLEKPDAN